MDKVNVEERPAPCDEYWSSKIVGEPDGQHVKLASLRGGFVWHHREKEDELFPVLQGRAGEFVVVPRGVEHRPVAEGEAHVMLFEPASTLSTANVRSELRAADGI